MIVCGKTWGYEEIKHIDIKKAFLFIALAGWIGLIGLIDTLSGVVPDLTILYLVPLAISAATLRVKYSLALVAIAETADFTSNLQLGIPIGPQLIIGEISRALVFLFAVLLVTRLVRDLEQIRSLEVRRSAELDIAHSVQESVLAPVPDSFADLLIAGKRASARELGGDYLYFSEVQGQLFFCIADISGKSVAAALFTAFLHYNLDDLLKEYRGLNWLVHDLNNRLYRTLPDVMFVTVFCAHIRADEIAFINMGHDPPLLYRAELDAILPLTSRIPMVMGVEPELDSPIERMEFKSGDMLLATTDGVTDSEAFRNRPAEQLRQFLAESKTDPPAMVVDALYGLVESSAAELQDDVTIACIART